MRTVSSTVTETIQRENSELNLEFDGYGYKWSGKSVPKELQGLWLNPVDARVQSENYIRKLQSEKERKSELVNWERTPLEELELITKKQPLLEFAEQYEITIPQGCKAPSSIKLVIKNALENADA